MPPPVKPKAKENVEAFKSSVVTNLEAMRSTDSKEKEPPQSVLISKGAFLSEHDLKLLLMYNRPSEAKTKFKDNLCRFCDTIICTNPNDAAAAYETKAAIHMDSVT